jgi:hypothetical protein
MSLTLNGESTLKIGPATYSEPKCAHGHARGAESLANWLWKKIGRPRIFTDGAEAKQELSEASGIIFFKNCFTREGENKKSGDHIDLWNRGTTKTYDDPDNNSEQVWFWELK